MIDYDSYSCNGAEANHAIFVALPSREFEIKKEPRNTFHDYRKQERYAEILKGLEKRVAVLRAEFNEHQKAQGAVTNYGHDMEDVSLLYARARKLYESDYSNASLCSGILLRVAIWACATKWVTVLRKTALKPFDFTAKRL